MKRGQSMVNYTFSTWRRVSKFLVWLSRETSVVNFRFTSVLSVQSKRHYLLPGKLGIYCSLTGSSCHGAIKKLYLLTCKSSIYFLYADVTASFLLVAACSIDSICTLVEQADTWFCREWAEAFYVMLVLCGQHNALTQCWLNVVPSFITLFQH